MALTEKQLEELDANSAYEEVSGADLASALAEIRRLRDELVEADKLHAATAKEALRIAEQRDRARADALKEAYRAVQALECGGEACGHRACMALDDAARAVWALKEK